MKKLSFAFLVIAIFGCGQNTNPQPASTTITDSEKKAIELAGNALGGQATGTVSADGKALELSITNSAALGLEPDLVKLHSSRAAWVFYQNMGTEQPAYLNIIVHSQLKDSIINSEYSLAQLATVKARMPAVETAADLLIKGDYSSLYALFDPVVMGTSKVSDLQGYCTQADPDHGKPESFEFKGFSFNKTSSGQDFLSLAGQLKRQIKDTPLNIAIDLSKPDLKGSLNSIKFDY